MRFAPACLLAITIGCGAAKPEPEIASSAAHPTYAASFPDAVQGSAKRFTESETEARRIEAEMKRYPDQAKGVDAARLRAAYDAAEASGKSQAFVDRMHNVEGATAFFAANGDKITRKVAGSAQFVAKQKSCDVDVSGAAAHALKESVDEQVEASLRERNEGHVLVDRWRAGLPKDTAAALDRQTDDLAFGSYLVHVAMVEEKLRLRRMVDEVEQVKKTADDYVAAERAWQAEGGRTDVDKKASEERIAAMTRARGRLDAAATEAKSVADGVDRRLTDAVTAWDQAMEELRKELGTRGAK